jgi:hypothetical protein
MDPDPDPEPDPDPAPDPTPFSLILREQKKKINFWFKWYFAGITVFHSAQYSTFMRKGKDLELDLCCSA